MRRQVFFDRLAHAIQNIVQRRPTVGRIPHAGKVQAAGIAQQEHRRLGEGMRQATKQFDRQVLGRAQALQEQGVKVNFPRGLQDDIAIMKKAQTDGWSPARVADALSQRGTSVEDVTRRAAGLLESLQKLRPR